MCLSSSNRGVSSLPRTLIKSSVLHLSCRRISILQAILLRFSPIDALSLSFSLFFSLAFHLPFPPVYSLASCPSLSRTAIHCDHRSTLAAETMCSDRNYPVASALPGPLPRWSRSDTFTLNLSAVRRNVNKARMTPT